MSTTTGRPRRSASFGPDGAGDEVDAGAGRERHDQAQRRRWRPGPVARTMQGQRPRRARRAPARRVMRYHGNFRRSSRYANHYPRRAARAQSKHSLKDESIRVHAETARHPLAPLRPAGLPAAPRAPDLRGGVRGRVPRPRPDAGPVRRAHGAQGPPGLGQSSLARALGFDKVTVLRVLRGLESRGLVERAPAPDNRRNMCVIAHAKRRERCWRRRSARPNVRTSGCWHRWTASQQEQLVHLLQLLTGELEDDARAAFVPPGRWSRSGVLRLDAPARQRGVVAHARIDPARALRACAPSSRTAPASSGSPSGTRRPGSSGRDART